MSGSEPTLDLVVQPADFLYNYLPVARCMVAKFIVNTLHRGVKPGDYIKFLYLDRIFPGTRMRTEKGDDAFPAHARSRKKYGPVHETRAQRSTIVALWGSWTACTMKNVGFILVSCKQ